MSESLISNTNLIDFNSIDTGMKKITENKSAPSGTAKRFVQDNLGGRSEITYVSFTGPAGALLIKIDISSFNIRAVSGETTGSHQPIGLCDRKLFVDYGSGNPEYGPELSNIHIGSTGSFSSWSISFTPPSASSFTIEVGIYGGGGQPRTSVNTSLTSAMNVTMSYLLISL